jgi:hypothetical protein
MGRNGNEVGGRPCITVPVDSRGEGTDRLLMLKGGRPGIAILVRAITFGMVMVRRRGGIMRMRLPQSFAALGSLVGAFL